jgi:uncharacterized damage-inducible protein DinB
MPHTRHQLVEARLKTARSDMGQILPRITPDMLGWAPAPGMRTIAGQLVEVAATELQLITQLRDGRWISDPEAAQIIGDCSDLDTLRQALGAFREQTLAFLHSLTPEQLEEEVEFDAGWFGSLGLPTIPRAEVFINVADHEWYHWGQLTTYLWTRGDDPYKW